MPELIAIVDTGVLCCWLEVPGRATAGGGQTVWNNARANDEIDRVTRQGGTLILPTSVIIETGNHIAQAPHSQRIKAIQLFERILASLDGRQPWKRFEEAGRLWTPEWYAQAHENWPRFAEMRIGLADYSIVSIARYFNELGSEVRTLTTERALFDEVGHLVAPQRSSRRRGQQ